MMLLSFYSLREPLFILITFIIPHCIFVLKKKNCILLLLQMYIQNGAPLKNYIEQEIYVHNNAVHKYSINVYKNVLSLFWDNLT